MEAGNEEPWRGEFWSFFRFFYTGGTGTAVGVARWWFPEGYVAFGGEVVDVLAYLTL